MDLKETLIKIKKETPEQFFINTSIIRRKAEKGLLEGYSAEDVDVIIDEIEDEEKIPEENENTLTGLISELSEAVDKYDYLCENDDTLTDNDIEMLALCEFCMSCGYDLDDILEEGYRDYDDYKEQKLSREEKYYRKKQKKKAKAEYAEDHPVKSKVETGAKIAGIAGGAAAAGGLTANAIITSKKNKEALSAAKQAAIDAQQDNIKYATDKITKEYIAKYGNNIETGKKIETAVSAAKNDIINNATSEATKNFIPKKSLASKIAGGVGTAIKSAGSWVVSHPVAMGALGATAAIGLGVLGRKIYKGIKKRRERRLTEGIDSQYYFSESTLCSVYAELIGLDESGILSIAAQDETMDLLISEAITFANSKDSLNETTTDTSFFESSLNEFENFRNVTIENLLK